ncbi:MAG: hypothetical protein ACYCUV_06055, partial [Phycisphaerae bacterium]
RLFNANFSSNIVGRWFRRLPPNRRRTILAVSFRASVKLGIVEVAAVADALKIYGGMGPKQQAV